MTKIYVQPTPREPGEAGKHLRRIAVHVDLMDGWDDIDSEIDTQTDGESG